MTSEKAYKHVQKFHQVLLIEVQFYNGIGIHTYHKIKEWEKR